MRKPKHTGPLSPDDGSDHTALMAQVNAPVPPIEVQALSHSNVQPPTDPKPIEFDPPAPRFQEGTPHDFDRVPPLPGQFENDLPKKEAVVETEEQALQALVKMSEDLGLYNAEFSFPFAGSVPLAQPNALTPKYAPKSIEDDVLSLKKDLLHAHQRIDKLIWLLERRAPHQGEPLFKPNEANVAR